MARLEKPHSQGRRQESKRELGDLVSGRYRETIQGQRAIDQQHSETFEPQLRNLRLLDLATPLRYRWLSQSNFQVSLAARARRELGGVRR